MTSVYSKTSFDLMCMFYDKNGVQITPESIEYTVYNGKTHEIIKTDTIDPLDIPIDPFVFRLPLTVDDNTITEDSERRKVVIDWTYNNGNDGDVEVYYYNIEQP